MKTIAALLVLCLALLPASAQKVSDMPQIYTIANSDLIMITKPGVANYKSTFINLASNLNGLITVAATVTNAISRGSNLAVTNNTSFGVFYAVSGLTNMQFFNLKQGTNMVLYRDGSNIVLNSTGGGGGGAGDVTTAQLNTASNAVVTMFIANDTTTSNGVMAEVVSSSNFLYSTETTRNAAVSNSLYSGETTRNAAVSNAVVALIAASGSTQFVVAAFGNVNVTNAVTANTLSVVTFNANTLTLTNALGSNQVRMGMQDLTNSAAVNPANGDLLAWDGPLLKWTNRVPSSFAASTQMVVAAFGDVNITNRLGVGIASPAARLHVVPTLSGTDYLRVDDTNSTRRITLGVYPTLATHGAIWLGSNAPSAANYAVASDGSGMSLNGSTINLNNGGANRLTMDADGNWRPGADGTRSLGILGTRWADGFFLGGIATFRSNMVASSTVAVGASPWNWTNTSLATSLTNNIFVTVDASTATTVATIAKNGQTRAVSVSSSALLVPLQLNEWITITYSGTTPTVQWETQ